MTGHRANAGLAIAVCILIAALEGYDIQAFGVAAPRLATEFRLGPGSVGWVAAAAMVGLIIGAVVGGWLADRVGRKPVLLASVVGFGAGSIWTALSPHLDVLLAARLAAGLGFGGAMPNLVAIAAEISRPERRGVTTCAIFCGMPAGGASVALLVSLLAGHGDWRMIFLVGGAAPLAIAPLVHVLLPETRPGPGDASRDRSSSVLFASGRAAPTVLLWTASLLTLVILYLMLNWLPSLVVAKGHPASDGANASLAFNLMAVFGALALGLAVDRSGYRWPLFAAFVGLALVMVGLSRVGAMGSILLLAAAAGFLVVGASFALYGLAPILYPPQVRALGAGAAIAVGRLGSVIGPILGGQLRQAGWPPGSVLLAMTPVALLAGLAVVVLTVLVPDLRRRPMI